MYCFKKDYSYFYDLLYKNKNYNKEFTFIKKIIKKYLKNPKTFMDLGCGTGEYSKLMTKLGMEVLGVDASKHMLNIAKNKFNSDKKLKFLLCDINKLNVNKKFDIVSALFHILSYQITKNSMTKFFINSQKHLKKDGILIFDFWFKKGVINLKKPLKYRKVTNKKFTVYRITRSKWFKKLDQIYDTHEMIVTNKKNNKTKIFIETHKMKFFTLEDIKNQLKKNKLKYLLSLDLSTNRKLTNNSWGALVVAKKI
jgi:ubiquinone/menaquinone biosynthesis C-methylase UbiE